MESCPEHPEGGCGFARHGTYARVEPAGCRIARWYCRAARKTFSKLPDGFSSRLRGSLAEVEQIVAVVERAGSMEAAADVARPDIQLPGAVRWTRRRSKTTFAVLAIVVGLLPDLLAGCEPTISSLRSRLGVEPALPVLREHAAAHLHALPPPLGFGPRLERRWRSPPPSQQETGPDPPSLAR